MSNLSFASRISNQYESASSLPKEVEQEWKDSIEKLASVLVKMLPRTSKKSHDNEIEDEVVQHEQDYIDKFCQSGALGSAAIISAIRTYNREREKKEKVLIQKVERLETRRQAIIEEAESNNQQVRANQAWRKVQASMAGSENQINPYQVMNVIIGQVRSSEDTNQRQAVSLNEKRHNLKTTLEGIKVEHREFMCLLNGIARLADQRGNDHLASFIKNQITDSSHHGIGIILD